MSQKKISCPECSFIFNPEEHGFNAGLGGAADSIRQMNDGDKSFLDLADECATIQCPSCKHLFINKRKKFFWFLPPRVAVMIYYLFMGAFLLFFGSMILSKLWEDIKNGIKWIKWAFF